MTRHLASAQYWAGLAGGDTGRLFLTFGGPVRADRISYCPLDRVLTYKNLIYLLNLQICQYFISIEMLTLTLLCPGTDTFCNIAYDYCAFESA